METVTVSDYNPEWIKEYEQEKIKICAALKDVFLGIEHIGSTSVPDLGAKPVIDIMVGVDNFQQISEEHIARLEDIGYEYVFKPEFLERRFFRRGQWRAGTHHLHIYEYGGKHWRDNFLFREYLKKNPQMMKEYYELKKKLEQQYKHDRVAYTEGKSEFIQGIIHMALKDTELMKCFKEMINT